MGYPSCVFFGFKVDIKGTHLADKNLDPVRRMVPPTNFSELRSTLGVFVQSARFIPRYARIAARLLLTAVPFALLLPAELTPRIADDGHFDDQPPLLQPYAHGGKIMFLDSDQVWFIGNIPLLHHFSKIYAQVLTRPAPLLEHFASQRNPSLPSTLDEWKHAQTSDPDFLSEIPSDSILLCDGLSLNKCPDFPSRILVPPSLREPLTRQHHADLNHVSHPKVLTSLARHYHWPSMKADVRRIIHDCEHCENEKGKRRLAHGMFSGHNTTKPRSRYSMDFQGQGKATSGETEALAIIDSFTKTVSVIALPNQPRSLHAGPPLT